MNEKEYLKSQKECASMLGMSLNEYNEYLKKVEVNNNTKKSTVNNHFLKALNIKESQLKLRKYWYSET